MKTGNYYGLMNFSKDYYGLIVDEAAPLITSSQRFLRFPVVDWLCAPPCVSVEPHSYSFVYQDIQPVVEGAPPHTAQGFREQHLCGCVIDSTVGSREGYRVQGYPSRKMLSFGLNVLS